MVTGDTNPDNIETGTITRNKILTTDGKTKEGPTPTKTKMATTSLSLKIQKRAAMIAGVTTRHIQYTQEELNELIELAITCTLQKNMQKDVNEINQQQETEVKSSQKLD